MEQTIVTLNDVRAVTLCAKPNHDLASHQKKKSTCQQLGSLATQKKHLRHHADARNSIIARFEVITKCKYNVLAWLDEWSNVRELCIRACACVCTHVCKNAYTRVCRLCTYISPLFCTKEQTATMSWTELCHHHHHHHHHHHVPEGLDMLSCSLILQMKLVPPSLPRSSYVSSSFWFIL